MRPTEGEPQRRATFAVRPGQMSIAAAGIDFDRAVEAVQYFGGIFALAPWAILEHHARRRRPVPAAILAQNGPEIPGFRPAASGVEPWCRGFVDMERITFNLIQIEGDPRQASRGLCCVSPLIR